MIYMANNDLSTRQAPVDTHALLDRAQRYCATAEHCPADVRQLLYRLGATAGQTDEIIGVLEQQNYLDTARYCRAFVHDKVTFQNWERIKVQMGLRAKHLPEGAIQDAIREMDESAYAANIRKLLRTRHNDDRQRLVRFMLQRGYTFDDLRRYAGIDAED